LLRFQIQLWRFCARRLRANNATAMSAALSFRTIFAMVPLIVLVFLVLKTLPVTRDHRQVLRDLFREGGLNQIVYLESPSPQSASQPASRPASQPGVSAGEAMADSGPPEAASSEVWGRQVTLAERIESILDSVEKRLTLRRLGPIGVVMFIWTALTLLTTIERCLNRIFEAPKSRSITRRALLYWSAVTLGPLLLVVAGYAGGRLMTGAQAVPGVSWLLKSVGWIGPIIVGVAVLVGVYCLMPNTRVPLRSAVEGALVAVPVWLVARWGFDLYVRNVGGKSIYGAIGLVPLFLLWLNLSWLIFLFGAELAHTVGNLSRMQSVEDSRRRLLGPWDLLAVIVSIVRENVRGGRPVTVEHVTRAVTVPSVAVKDLLDRLVAHGLICPVAGEDQCSGYLPARPAGSISVAEVLRIGRTGGASDGAAGPDNIVAAIERLRQRTETDLENVTLEQLIEND
jgi:membrane protein